MMRLKELSRDTHKRKANPQIPHSYHWASFLVSLCSICQGMTSAENILSQLVKLPIWWLALFWEHLVYHHIWGSNWSFFHHWGQLFPRNWPSNWARRSWIKFFFFFIWKLHVTYLKYLVTLDLHEAGKEKAMPYEAPKYIFYPVSPTWLLLYLPLCKSLSDIFALLAWL